MTLSPAAYPGTHALCDESIVRDGDDAPCERPAVTYRNDTASGEGVYPVCRRHAGPMVLGVLIADRPALADIAAVGVALLGAKVMGA